MPPHPVGTDPTDEATPAETAPDGRVTLTTASDAYSILTATEPTLRIVAVP